MYACTCAHVYTNVPQGVSAHMCVYVHSWGGHRKTLRSSLPILCFISAAQGALIIHPPLLLQC